MHHITVKELVGDLTGPNLDLGIPEVDHYELEAMARACAECANAIRDALQLFIARLAMLNVECTKSFQKELLETVQGCVHGDGTASLVE